MNAYVKELHFLREPLGKTIYQAIGKLEELQKYVLLEFELPWSDLITVSREQLNEKMEVLEKLAVQSEIFDKKSTHPWRGFVVKNEQPILSEEIKKICKLYQIILNPLIIL